jgi:predicted transposase/invertase (TIGR01784 family)
MKHKINPTVDCVFKAILGSEENKNLLIHFLNAILELTEGSRIKEVVLKDPYNEREFMSDKLTIVDVKAIDEKGHRYQIEVQLAVHAALAARILYTWSTVYHSQLQKGKNFQKLKPVISIWILDGNLFENIEEYHLPFSLYNQKHQVVLTDHISIHLLQLPKWQKETISTEKDRWIYLFKEGKNVDCDNPPETLNTEEMRQVMNVLHRFSENEANYLRYQSRLEAILVQNTILQEKEQERQEKEQALQLAEREKQEKEQALQLVAREKQEKEQALKLAEQEKKQLQEKLNQLQLLLKEKGIGPDNEPK